MKYSRHEQKLLNYSIADYETTIRGCGCKNKKQMVGVTALRDHL
ncbi:MAG: hypothetical protein ACKVK0_13780 [Pirellulales bacterium]